MYYCFPILFTNQILYLIILGGVCKKNVSIVRGTKGKPKLMLGGYSYFQNNVSEKKVYWLCAKNRYERCKARVITTAIGEVIIKNQTHNHPQENFSE